MPAATLAAVSLLVAGLNVQWGPRTEPVAENRFAAVWHVSPLGSDLEGRGTPERPWRTIRRALEACGDASAARRYAVKVAAGSYAEGTIALRPYVELYGGFDPSTWKRDLFTHAAVLEGRGQERVLLGADHAVLDGFHVRGGAVRGPGGGVLCAGTSPIIRNNLFTENRTLAPQPWNPRHWHETANDGGAIACLAGSRPRIEQNLFVGNQTEIGRGGALAYSRAGGRLAANVFWANTAGIADPMRSSDGGAISIWDWSDPEVEGNLVIENRAVARNDGGGIFVALWSSPILSRNLIVGNYADDDGGGLFVGGQKHHYDSPPDPMPSAENYLVKILANVIAGNASLGAASGALRVTMESRILFANNILDENLGPARFQRSEVTVVHNTFLTPVTYEELRNNFRPPVFANNIFRRGFQAEKGVTVTYSNVSAQVDGEGNFTAPPGFLQDEVQVVAVRTAYRRERFQTEIEAQGDWRQAVGRVARAGGRWTAVAGGGCGRLWVWGDFSRERVFEFLPTYRLRAGSPCIDAGDNAHSVGEDRLGRRRPLNGGKGWRVDVGAYEFDPTERR